jgi:hypothetical protein
MSAPGPITQNRAAFDATFTGEASEAKKREEAARGLVSATGISAEGAKWMVRLYGDFEALKNKLNLPDETRSAVNAYEIFWADVLATGSPDRGKMVQLVALTADIMPIVETALQQSNLEIDPHDHVRLLSAGTKSLCAICVALEKQNSILLPRVLITADSLRSLIDKLGDQLAVEKLAQSGVRAQLSSMEGAHEALGCGKQAIGYHLDRKTGKITFTKLEIRNSVFGYGGRPAPVLEGGKANWKSCMVFSKDFAADPASRLFLIRLPTPFPAFEDLPVPIKGFEGVGDLASHQQQPFLDGLNEKWQGWRDDYKGRRPDDTDDDDALVGKIIAEENIKQAITAMVAKAKAVSEPQPDPAQPPT